MIGQQGNAAEGLNEICFPWDLIIDLLEKFWILLKSIFK